MLWSHTFFFSSSFSIGTLSYIAVLLNGCWCVEWRQSWAHFYHLGARAFHFICRCSRFMDGRNVLTRAAAAVWDKFIQLNAYNFVCTAPSVIPTTEKCGALGDDARKIYFPLNIHLRVPKLHACAAALGAFLPVSAHSSHALITHIVQSQLTLC